MEGSPGAWLPGWGWGHGGGHSPVPVLGEVSLDERGVSPDKDGTCYEDAGRGLLTVGGWEGGCG